jgi:S-adenosyl-L-methionine hydrolase (adenosine-forming)
MLRIAPGVSIIDLTHEVPGFEVETGAEILQHATRYMPADTVYLAVVDPGVGTKRRELALRAGSGALLVGPDNGLLVPAAESLGGISGARLQHLSRPRRLRPGSGPSCGRGWALGPGGACGPFFTDASQTGERKGR